MGDLLVALARAADKVFPGSILQGNAVDQGAAGRSLLGISGPGKLELLWELDVHKGDRHTVHSGRRHKAILLNRRLLPAEACLVGVGSWGVARSVLAEHVQPAFGACERRRVVLAIRCRGLERRGGGQHPARAVAWSSQSTFAVGCRVLLYGLLLAWRAVSESIQRTLHSFVRCTAPAV